MIEKARMLVTRHSFLTHIQCWGPLLVSFYFIHYSSIRYYSLTSRKTETQGNVKKLVQNKSQRKQVARALEVHAQRCAVSLPQQTFFLEEPVTTEVWLISISVSLALEYEFLQSSFFFLNITLFS